MAKKKASPNLAFAVAQLRKNPKITFGALKSAADRKGLKVVPIVFGRAKLALGIQRKGGRKVAAGRAAKGGNGLHGLLGKDIGKDIKNGKLEAMNGSLGRILEAVRQAEAQRLVLAQIKAMLDTVPGLKRGRGRPRKSL
jgi:hypothetical protein